jgi:hypothetical protein
LNWEPTEYSNIQVSFKHMDQVIVPELFRDIPENASSITFYRET